MVDKKVVYLGAFVGMTLGGCLPMLWGDYNGFDMASLLLGMVGGVMGIWAAVMLGKRLG